MPGGGGMLECGEFVLGVGPEVFGGAGDVEEAGGEEGEEHVLVEGGFAVVEVFVVVAEPVGEGGVDVGDGFGVGVFVAVEGGTGAAGLGGDGEGEAFVLGGGPEGGIARLRGSGRRGRCGLGRGRDRW